MQNSDLCRAIYDILKKCITDKEQVMASMTCTEKALSNSYAAAPGKTVNKRYPETLKIAALAEINRMLGSSEIAGQVKCLLATDKKFVNCVKTCMDKNTKNCIKKLGCGLDVSNDELVQTFQQRTRSDR